MFGISMKKKALTFAAGGAMAAAALLATSGAAHASGFSVRLSPASNPFLFVDVSGGSRGDGAPLIQWSISGDNQVWTFQPSGTAYQIVNRNSGKCITSDGVAGHQLYQWACHGTANQLWSTSLTPGNLVGYTIKNVASNLYMDVAGSSGAQGAAIDTWTRNGGSNQFFLAHAA
ncbi:RICIN domain-containing protein [Streptosporangiaceae bacterium NEAU-GS5]|nr:RICIN domain-containing protein [Streptosporangiaceae bacterium NEAU-GS5]